MLPFFFGDSAAPLYGVSHSPQGDQYRSIAVLLCNPVGHEYIRSHRTIRRLADALSRRGYHVLRFDYHGTGDSSGDFDESDLSGWCADIKVAADELEALSGLNRVCAIGLRLGALLAYKADAECKFNKLLMWDPIIDGSCYVRSLRKLHAELLVSTYYYSSVRHESETPVNELVGYVYSQKLLDELQLTALGEMPVPDCLVSIINSMDSAAIDNFVSRTSGKILTEVIADMGDWDELHTIETSLTTGNIAEYIYKEIV